LDRSLFAEEIIYYKDIKSLTHVKDTELYEQCSAYLAAELIKLRNAIRRDRDSSGHDLCHYRPELWEFVPEGDTSPKRTVPNFLVFMWRCFWFRWNLTKKGNCYHVSCL